MPVRVAINGFGRIGRNILRAIVESGRTDIEVVALNDLGPVETNAHLLRYDSVHGKFPHTVTVAGDTIDAGRGPMKVTAVKDPTQLPWKELNIDIAMECTGIFTARDKAAAHLTAVPEVKEALKKRGREDIMIVIGGVIPPQDYDALYKAGAEAIFPPGTVIADAAEELIRKLNVRLGHSSAAAE